MPEPRKTKPKRAPTVAGVKIRNRIRGLEYLDPATIDEAPGNWRVHKPEQRVALQTLLEQVGIAGAIVVFEHNGRYQLIDGHLRREMIGNQVPALVLDVDEQEARILLASMDAIGELAGRDDDAFQRLIEELDELATGERAALADLLREIEIDAGGVEDEVFEELQSQGQAEYPITPSFDEGYDYVLIFCRTTGEFAQLQSLLGLEQRQKAEGAHVGICRVLEAPDFIDKWRSRS